MGFNPFKAAKGIVKPFKKVLKSPIGKAALGIGAFMYGPKLFGTGNKLGGLGGWGQAKNIFSSMTDWKKSLIVGGNTAGIGAAGDEVMEKSTTVVDDTGHKGYLTARKGFVDEWAQWLMDQDDTLTYEEAVAQASSPLFNKAEGGIVGLAQGGRIGMAGGAPPGEVGGPGPTRSEQRTLSRGIGRQDQMGGKPGYTAQQIRTLDPAQYGGGMTIGHGGMGQSTGAVPILPKIKPEPTAENRVTTPFLRGHINKFTDWVNNTKLGQWNQNMQHTNFLEHLKKNNPEAYEETIEDLIATNYAKKDVELFGPEGKREGPMAPGRDILKFDNLGDRQVTEILNAVGPTGLYTKYLNRFNVPTQGGDGPQEEWQRLGYPSYEAYLAAMQGGAGTGGGGTGDTTSDYYGFKEWEDWEGGPTTPLFSDATKYKALLNKGGRIGLYAGGMGAMNNPMNPMMNQGLGAMGSPGMNPYNQQNLMAHAQRGQPTGGRPPMPGGPTTAQGPGITGTQAGAALAKKEDDGDLLKLIRMLASMGIPMEQLRGRTKEELVEMVMSLSAKAESQGGGQEVIEEQEEVVEAAHGGRVRAAGGLGEMYPPQGSYPNSDLEFQTEEQASMGNPGNAEMYVEDEEEEIYTPRAQGGLMRTGYAMGTEQPIIPSRDGPQIDYRGIGGYQPHGAKEKKDDVRALLAQGEFVVTSDAVKGIGEGDRDLGAKRMYDMMHKYEPIGRALS